MPQGEKITWATVGPFVGWRILMHDSKWILTSKAADIRDGEGGVLSSNEPLTISEGLVQKMIIA